MQEKTWKIQSKFSKILLWILTRFRTGKSKQHNAISGNTSNITIKRKLPIPKGQWKIIKAFNVEAMKTEIDFLCNILCFNVTCNNVTYSAGDVSFVVHPRRRSQHDRGRTRVNAILCDIENFAWKFIYDDCYCK